MTAGARLRGVKAAALILLAVLAIIVIGWNVAPDWFRSGLAIYAREKGFVPPVESYERWRVRRAGYNYDVILSKCGQAGEGNLGLVQSLTMRDAEYVSTEPQVRVKGGRIVADVPMQITGGSMVIPSQQHCEYDIATGAIIRSETLRVKR